MLQKLFKNLMLKATSQQDKQLRNDVLMITSLIASLCPEAPFVVRHFFDRDMNVGLNFKLLVMYVHTLFVIGNRIFK